MSFYCLSFDLSLQAPSGPAHLALLHRLARAARSRGVQVLAFGIGSQVRLVVRGTPAAVTSVSRGLRVGTQRWAVSRGYPISLGPTVRVECHTDELAACVRWAHAAAEEAMWSSAWDLLGYRVAGFYQPDALTRWVPLAEAVEPAAGLELPKVPSVAQLLHAAGAALGVLPCDPACFGLFVQLGLAYNYTTDVMARALCVTRRRVNQLRNADVVGLEVALRAIS